MPANLWSSEEKEHFVACWPHAFAEEHGLLFPRHNPSQLKNAAIRYGVSAATKKVFFPRKFSDVGDGWYVTGLTDGEGCFGASIVYRRGRENFNPRFVLGLRLDDRPIVDWLRNYFGVGSVVEDPNRPSPAVRLVVASLYELLYAVVPHFDRFPLRAKKQNDYAIWRQMVMLQAEYFRKPWPPQVRRQMRELYQALVAQRLYKGNTHVRAD